MSATYIFDGVKERKFTAIADDLRRMDIRLFHDRNTEQVFWTHGNSYVVNDNPAGYWTAPNGVPCDLVSINGMGEIRWLVSWSGGNTAGDVDAAEYFGLRWYGIRAAHDARD